MQPAKIIAIIISVICLVSVIVMGAVMESYQIKYAQALAAEQMNMDGGLEYAEYHRIIQNIQTAQYILTGCIVTTICIAGFKIVSNKHRQEKER